MSNMRLTLHLSAIDNMSKIVRGATNKSLASLQSMQQRSTMIATRARSNMMDAGIMAAGGALALAYPLKMAANYEKLRLSMNIFTGNAKEGGRVFQETINLAARTPLGLQEISRATTMMMGYGQAADDALKSTKMLGDITALTPAGDLNAAIVAYGQAAQEGKALTRDLRQFINAGVPIVDILKKTFGSDAKIMDLASQGKITFKVLKESLEAATSSGGKFNDGLKQLSETASGQWIVLVDEIGRMAAVFGDSVLPMMKDLMTWIKPIIVDFAAWAKQNEWFTKTVMLAVAGFTAFAAIGLVFSGTIWVGATALGGFAKVMRGVIGGVGLLKDGLLLLGRGFLYVIMNAGKVIGVMRTFALVSIPSAVSGIGTIISSIGAWIVANTALSASMVAALAWTAAVFAAALMISAAITAIAYVIYKNWDKIVAFFTKIKDKFKEFVQSSSTFGSDIMTGIVGGLRLAMPLLFNTIDLIKGALSFFGGDSKSGTVTKSVVKEFVKTKNTVSGAVNDVASNAVSRAGFSGVAPMAAASGSSVSINYNPTISMEGGVGSQSDMASLLEDHKTEITRMVQEEVRLSDRKKA